MRFRLQRSIFLAGALVLAEIALNLTPAVIPPTAQAAAANCRSTVFTSSSKYRYRLPAVVKTDSGKVFAFAEKRNNNYDNDDDGDFDIVMRISGDGGCTWGAQRTVMNEGKLRVSNPVAVYVPKTDRVLLFATVKTNAKTNRNRLYLTSFTAAGAVVKAPAEVVVDNWRPGLTGPGHGVVLTTGAHAGRIVFPMGYTDSKSGKRIGRGIYSDDDGATWQVGYDRTSPGSLQLIEGAVTQLTSGNLLVTYRDNGKGVKTPGKNRVSAISTDGGESLGSFAAMSGIKTVPVQGSVLQLTGSHSNMVVFSSPSWTSGKITSRRGMRIFVSTNAGASWKSGLAIGEATDSACYSDLVQLRDDALGLIYESGYGSYWKKIVFVTVPLETVAATLLPPLSKASSPRASGTAKVAKTLKASAGVWSPVPVAVSYRWLRNGKPIAGATGQAYKLKRADRGKKVQVRVTVTASGHSATTAVSSSRKVR